MPYISKDQVAAKRKAIRKALPEFKISVRFDGGTGINVTLKSGPALFPQSVLDDSHGYVQVNHRRLESMYQDNPLALAVFLQIRHICQQGMTGGHSDSDYGWVPGWRVNINYGSWDRPYEVTMPNNQPRLQMIPGGKK